MLTFIKHNLILEHRALFKPTKAIETEEFPNEILSDEEIIINVDWLY